MRLNKFIHSVVISNFFILDLKGPSGKKILLGCRTKTAAGFFCSLDLFFLNKSLKQFIRNLQQIQISGGKIFMFVENTTTRMLLNELLKSF